MSTFSYNMVSEGTYPWSGNEAAKTQSLIYDGNMIDSSFSLPTEQRGNWSMGLSSPPLDWQTSFVPSRLSMTESRFLYFNNSALTYLRGTVPTANFPPTVNDNAAIQYPWAQLSISNQSKDTQAPTLFNEGDSFQTGTPSGPRQVTNTKYISLL